MPNIGCLEAGISEKVGTFLFEMIVLSKERGVNNTKSPASNRQLLDLSCKGFFATDSPTFATHSTRLQIVLQHFMIGPFCQYGVWLDASVQ